MFGPHADFTTTNINEKENVFLRITEGLINEHFPEKTIKSHDKDKPFITQKIKSLMVKRDKAFRNKNYGRFKYFRRLVSAEIRKAKSSFL